jgi:pseudouridine synthase
MHPVGRLDQDTHGLLLWSASGALTKRLLAPRHAVEREYEAVVQGTVSGRTPDGRRARAVATSRN